MKKTFVCSAFLVFGFLQCAMAGNVKEVPSIAALDDETLGPNVNVANYYAGSGDMDGPGGQFIQNGTTCSPDGGVIIQTTGGLCYYRQFAGPVHMNWYGVNSGSAHRDASAAQFANAFIAAGKYGNGTVVTDGVAINYTGAGNLQVKLSIAREQSGGE